MKQINKAPKGTLDVLPDQSYKHQFIEKIAMDKAFKFGFKEMRVPTFEHTEVFTGSVGETSDIVQKEMYTFLDKANRSLTLRPEQTAGIARAMIEHGLLKQSLPQKVCTIGAAFRYEQPQAGRYREFSQINMETYGAIHPSADAEIISLAKEILLGLGIKDITLKINSVGCPKCQEEYFDILKKYFSEHIDNLDSDSLKRLDTNPMRILDSKVKSTKEIVKNAPKIIDHLCEDCKNHFDEVKTYLESISIKYDVDPLIVRGLDYYTKTVFEFISNDIGSQGTVCGGGRYDLLIEKRGGPSTPAIGFGMGLERILLVMESLNLPFLENEPTEIFIAAIGEDATKKAFCLVTEFREMDCSAQSDLMNRSIKAQMRYANRINAKYSIVLGENELEKNIVNLRNMDTGVDFEISLDAKEIFEAIKK